MKFYENLDLAMENLSKGRGFLTVKGDNIVNTMTIGWGYIGYSWNKPFFVAMVRPQRYTQDIIQKGNSFTVSIPTDDKMKNALMICGTKSGRDIDKEEEANIKFVSSKVVNSPIVDNCDLYYECEIKYVEQINSDKFPEELKKNYPNEDYHYLYYGEILECYIK